MNKNLKNDGKNKIRAGLIIITIFVLFLLATSVSAGKIETKNYTVEGSTTNEIWKNILKEAKKLNITENGNVYPSETRADVNIDVKYDNPVKKKLNCCCECKIKVKESNIEIDTTVVYPEWKKPKNPDKDVEKEWNRFMGALKKHEEGHVSMYQAAEGKLNDEVKKLEGVGIAKTCEEACKLAKEDLDEKIDSVINTILEETEKAQNEYETESKHGEKQGASLGAGEGNYKNFDDMIKKLIDKIKNMNVKVSDKPKVGGDCDEKCTAELPGDKDKSSSGKRSSAVPKYIFIGSIIISLILFTAGYKTKNNLFYIAGVGSLLIGGGVYFLLTSEESPPPEFFEEEHLLETETLDPIKQIDLLLTNANKNKQSGDTAAEKLDLLNALDISLKNNLPEKTEIIETKLSDTTRREATEHRRSGNYNDAKKSADESIKYNLENPWAYVEGIINSEEMENHDDAVDYADDLDEIEPTDGTATDFPLDTQTVNDYKDYAVDINNEGTATAKTAETVDNIADAIDAVKTGAEYLGEGLAISENLDIAGVSDTPTAAIVGNLVSANNNLIVLQTQAGKFSDAKNAASDTMEIIEEYPDIVPDTVKSATLSNTATVYALSREYEIAIDYAKQSGTACANNVIASSLTALGGKENVMDALSYAQTAVELEPGNEIYNDNLNTIREAIENEDWYDIEVNFGVSVSYAHLNVFLSEESGTFPCAQGLDELIDLDCNTEECLCKEASNVKKDDEEYIKNFEGRETLFKVAKNLSVNLTSSTINASRKESKKECTLLVIRIKANKTLPNTETAVNEWIKKFMENNGSATEFIPVADTLFFLEICRSESGKYHITGKWVNVTRGVVVYYDFYIGNDLEEGLKKVIKTFKDKYGWDNK